jgi:hypothetical protein
MIEADQLLLKIRNACAIIGRDSGGRVVIQLVLDEADADQLLAFDADAAGRDSERDDSPYREPPVSVCWLESA